MNTQPAQTRPAHPVLATLATVWNATFGLIIGPKGFFGPGFFSDFKEGWEEGTRPKAKPAMASVPAQGTMAPEHKLEDDDGIYWLEEEEENEEEEEANGFWCNLDRTDPLDPFDYDGYDNYLNYLKRQ